MKKTIIIGLLFLTTFTFAQNWTNNLETAKENAKKENKNILLVFSGSDWCAPCIKLDRNVFQSEVFKSEAEKKWILVKADFPKKKANLLSKELSESNKKLADKYNKAGNFPLVVLLNADGKTFGLTGFKNVPAIDYVQIINNLEKK